MRIIVNQSRTSGRHGDDDIKMLPDKFSVSKLFNFLARGAFAGMNIFSLLAASRYREA